MKKFIITMSSNTDYPLTGSDAPASFSPAAETALDSYVLNEGFTDKVALVGVDSFRIRRARVSNAGLDIKGNGPVAAKLVFKVGKVDAGALVGDAFADVEFNVGKWDQWEEKDILVNLDSSADNSLNRPCILFLETATEFNVYDFNVDSGMVGEDITPVIELEIEAPNILDASTGLAI